MMDFFIERIAKVIGRRIERGSAYGAFQGAVAGILVGMGASVLLDWAGWISPYFRVAMVLILSIPLGITGALIGSAIGPQSSNVEAAGHLRLTQYNRASVWVALSLIFFPIVFFGWIMLVKSQDEPEEWWKTAAYLTADTGIFLWFVVSAIRAIWLVELGSNIYVRRLLSRRLYRRDEMESWGFEAGKNRTFQGAFSGKRICRLKFRNGSICRWEVDGRDSRAVVEILGIDEKRSNRQGQSYVLDS